MQRNNKNTRRKGKRKSRKKIDGIIAMVMAIGAMFADREFDYEESLNNYLDIF